MAILQDSVHSDKCTCDTASGFDAELKIGSIKAPCSSSVKEKVCFTGGGDDSRLFCSVLQWLITFDPKKAEKNKPVFWIPHMALMVGRDFFPQANQIF